VLAARDIIQATESKQPSHRLLLGDAAYDGAVGKLDRLREEFQEQEGEARAVDRVPV
jgi:hypothetical protein